MTQTRRNLALFALLSFMLALPAGFNAKTISTAAQPNLRINGFFSANKAQRGRTIQAAVVVEIPSGYHVNSSRPLSKFAIPTSLKIEAPRGIRISAVSYPRAVTRRFSFSPDPMAVYEGRAVLRFSVTVPANFSEGGVVELRARLRYQSCTDEVCFPPDTRTINMPITVVGAGDSVQRINTNLFGRRG
jgi:DsbC/DsbD-like thiol-disulfide interchange protein